MKYLNKVDNSKNNLFFVFWIAGIFGALAGLSNSSWHDAIEGAQVLAGTVPYPEPTPFFLYHIKTWTLINQLPALFLKIGFSEIQISIFLSALTGTLAYQCLAGSFYVFSDDKWLALLFPFLVDSAKLLSSAPNYPVLLMGVSASYGILGLMYCFLTMILLSSDRFRSGGVMLGLALAIHPPLAILTWLIVGIASVTFLRESVKSIVPFFIIGLVLSAFSFIIYQSTIAPYPPFEAFSAQELGRFIRNWDSHRYRVALTHLPTLLILFLEFLVLKLPKEQTTLPLRRLSGLLFISGILALLAAALWTIPQERIPLFLIRLMPTRIVNFNILAAAALICGLLHRYPSILFQFFFVFFTTGLLIIGIQWPELTDTALIVTALGTGFLLLYPKKDFAARPHGFILPGNILLFLTLILFAFTNFPKKSLGVTHFKAVFTDWSNDAFFSNVRKDQGILLLDPKLGTMQLVTRRPVLLDPGSLDVVSYLPELGPQVVRIFKEIYGIDLFGQVEDFDEFLYLEIGSNLRLWETRKTEDWKAIREKFGVTQVLTAGGRLQLPEAARNKKYALYNIPQD